MDVTSYSFHQKQISSNHKINPLESGWKVVGVWLEVSFQKDPSNWNVSPGRLTNAPLNRRDRSHKPSHPGIVLRLSLNCLVFWLSPQRARAQVDLDSQWVGGNCLFSGYAT